MTDVQLPPLPEPKWRLTQPPNNLSRIFHAQPTMPTRVYSPDEMQGYGEACARAAAIAMRERCAQVCEVIEKDTWGEWLSQNDPHYLGRSCAAKECADAIRAETTIRKGE